MTDRDPRSAPPPLPNHLGRSDNVFGTSAPMPAPGEPEDAIELWGRRIGRTLAVLAAIVIIAMFLWPRL